VNIKLRLESNKDGTSLLINENNRVLAVLNSEDLGIEPIFDGESRYVHLTTHRVDLAKIEIKLVNAYKSMERIIEHVGMEMKGE